MTNDIQSEMIPLPINTSLTEGGAPLMAAVQIKHVNNLQVGEH